MSGAGGVSARAGMPRSVSSASRTGVACHGTLRTTKAGSDASSSSRVSGVATRKSFASATRVADDVVSTPLTSKRSGNARATRR